MENENESEEAELKDKLFDLKMKNSNIFSKRNSVGTINNEKSLLRGLSQSASSKSGE